MSNRDRLDDLLKYEYRAPFLNRQGFLSRALLRLEDGQHVYTLVQGGRLLHSGWVAPAQGEAFREETDTDYAYPERSLVLHDFYSFPDAPALELFEKNLCHMLVELCAAPDRRDVYLVIAAGDDSTAGVAEKLGFVFQCSVSGLRHHRKQGTKMNPVSS